MVTTGSNLEVIERDIPAGSFTFIPIGSISYPPDGINVPGVSRIVAFLLVCRIDGQDTTVIIPAGGNSVVLLNGKNAFIAVGPTELEFRYYPSDSDLCNAAAMRVLPLTRLPPPARPMISDATQALMKTTFQEQFYVFSAI